MKRLLLRILDRLIDRIAERTAQRVAGSWADLPGPFTDRVAYRVRLETQLAAAAGKTPAQLFAGASDGYWYWLLTEGLRLSPELQAILPGLPDTTLQAANVGASGDDALKLGFAAYTVFKQLFEKHKGGLSDCAAVLDFGCGWGRILRFFLRDIEPDRLHGLEAEEYFLDACRRTYRWGNFQLGGFEPPAPYTENQFDLVYAYSVFSHFAEDLHRRWLLDLHRVLKPGGLLIVTTRERAFIERVDDWRRNNVQLWDPEYTRRVVRCFPDKEQALAAYDRGDFCFAPLGLEDEWSNYGEACISKAYVERHWTPQFTLLDYIDDYTICGQNVIALRKEPAP